MAPPPRPRNRFERFITRRISRASPQTLAHYARLLAPKQTLTRTPGWTFGSAYYRDDIVTFARKLIWQRYHDEQIDRPLTVNWCNGLKLDLRLGNDIGWCVFVGGAYEPNELAFLRATLEPGMTVVDIGANEGLYTLFAASRVGEHGRVFAFEPSSREFGRLLVNISRNRLENIEAFRLALFAHAGTSHLAIAEANHGGHNALGNRIANPQINVTGSENIELQTLDAFTQKLDRLDFVKLDAEGSEAHILQGGLATVRRFQPVMLIEIAPEYLVAQGSTLDKLNGLLAELNYRTWIFDSEGLPRPHGYDEELSANVVAGPPNWTPPEIR